MHELNFEILSDALISFSFRLLGIFSFQEATQYIWNLPYKRNVFKDNVLCVFEDGGVTFKFCTIPTVQFLPSGTNILWPIIKVSDSLDL